MTTAMCMFCEKNMIISYVVDDLKVFAKNDDMIDAVEKQLTKQFKLKTWVGLSRF